MHPNDFFHNEPSVKGGSCFVVMPFKAHFSDEVYTKIGSTLKDLDITCHRADEDIQGGAVMTDVLRGLAEAETVIVDITGNNPNVFYELGIAHAVRCEKSVLLITQDIKNVPFDVKHLRCIEYALGEHGLKTLGEKLTDMIKEKILPTRFVYRWSEDKEGKSSDRFMCEGRKLYSFKICDVTPGQDAAEFRLVVIQHTGGLQEEVYNEMQPALNVEETVVIPKIPAWAIKLHSATSSEVAFCACRSDS